MVCITVLVHFLRHSSGCREIQIGIKPSGLLISQRYFTAVLKEGRRIYIPLLAQIYDLRGNAPYSLPVTMSTIKGGARARTGQHEKLVEQE